MKILKELQNHSIRIETDLFYEGAGMLMLEDYDEAKKRCEYHWRNYWLWNHE